METKMKANQKRPIAGKSGKSLVGKARYEQISCAMDQYKNAMKDGYYIEAIALMESAICDRMESTLNYLYPCTDFSYGTIGRLADNLIKPNAFLKSYYQISKIGQKNVMMRFIRWLNYYLITTRASKNVTLN